MTSNYAIFVTYKGKNLSLVQDSWLKIHVTKIILAVELSAFCDPLVLLWLSYGALTWIRSTFLDEPSGHLTSGRLFPKGLKKAECEEGSKVMRRYMLLSNIGSSSYEAGLVVPYNGLATSSIDERMRNDNKFQLALHNERHYHYSIIYKIL